MSDWLFGMWVTTNADPRTAVPMDMTHPTLLLAFPGEEDEDRVHCGEDTNDGRVVCRMWKDHPGPHIPFARELVEQSGVFVMEVAE